MEGDRKATASERSPAEAAVVSIFSNTTFPKNKSEIIDYAQKNKGKTTFAKELIDVIHQIPERTYNDIHDLEREIEHVS